jgi:hypothetical protein
MAHVAADLRESADDDRVATDELQTFRAPSTMLATAAVIVWIG